MDEEKFAPCIYNERVNCTEVKCAFCGWNPEVAEKRLRAHRISQLQNLLPDQKLYKIPFTGYCEVWAGSPEEAIEKASNEDMFFVRYEFDQATCLTKEGENEG
jgi:hypothetical protein